MDPAELDRILSGLPAVSDPNVLVGYSGRDDATVYRLPSGEQIVQTVDFFTPVVDDPYDYGSIAAANSLSDVYAMNARPLFALNICCFPRKHSFELWREVLRGGGDKAAEAGIAIVGGHTVDDSEPKYGLVVTGLVDPGAIWVNEGAKPGDALLLTKPIGTGLITTALKNELVSAAEVAEAIGAMKTLNRTAADVLRGFDVHACTDITGNGLIGHASEMMEASRVGLELHAADIPLFSLARDLAEGGKFPGGTFANRGYYERLVDLDSSVPESLSWLLFDAQTSGGLLAAVAGSQAETALAELRRAGVTAAALIGWVVADERMRIVK
ncbi:MAG: selenide, water dikinase SelD [bacterium]|nr:selenide, water dikinase SelD [bacterium]